MRRAELAPVSAPAWHAGTGSPRVGSEPVGPRVFGLLGAAMLAVVVAGLMPTGPIGRQHASRAPAVGRLPSAAWGPVSGALGRADPYYRVLRTGAGFFARNPRRD
jgi:hypothetical protein